MGSLIREKQKIVGIELALSSECGQPSFFGNNFYIQSNNL